MKRTVEMTKKINVSVVMRKKRVIEMSVRVVMKKSLLNMRWWNAENAKRSFVKIVVPKLLNLTTKK
jgi:hypothetical protein